MRSCVLMGTSTSPSAGASIQYDVHTSIQKPLKATTSLDLLVEGSNTPSPHLDPPKNAETTQQNRAIVRNTAIPHRPPQEYNTCRSDPPSRPHLKAHHRIANSKPCRPQTPRRSRTRSVKQGRRPHGEAGREASTMAEGPTAKPDAKRQPRPKAPRRSRTRSVNLPSWRSQRMAR